MGANSFLNEMTLIDMGDYHENDRVSFPESVPIHFKGKDLFLQEKILSFKNRNPHGFILQEGKQEVKQEDHSGPVSLP